MKYINVALTEIVNQQADRYTLSNVKDIFISLSTWSFLMHHYISAQVKNIDFRKRFHKTLSILPMCNSINERVVSNISYHSMVSAVCNSSRQS